MEHSETEPSKSRAALAQLERALLRLEGMVARKNGDLFLSDDLKAARAEIVRLDKAAAEVEGRIGAVIGRLKGILVE